MDETELLRQLQKQRAGALEQAVAQYGAYVLAIIRNRSRGVLTPEDHEEIASDVFFALWNGAARIERGQLRPWLGAVARNRTAEAMRQAERLSSAGGRYAYHARPALGADDGKGALRGHRTGHAYPAG